MLIRRATIPNPSRRAVDRAMRALGLEGIRRDKGVRTTIPAKEGIPSGDFTALTLSSFHVTPAHTGPSSEGFGCGARPWLVAAWRRSTFHRDLRCQVGKHLARSVVVLRADVLTRRADRGVHQYQGRPPIRSVLLRDCD